MRKREATPARWKWKRVLVCVGVLLVLAAIADYAFYSLLPVGGQSFNRGENGVWLRDSWYRGNEKQSIQSLATRLQRNQFRYAYFHVRFIKKDGTLRFRGQEYSHRARLLNKQLQQYAPNIKSLAWIYVGNERGITGVDLSDQKVRRAMVKQASWLVEECGFDGV